MRAQVEIFVNRMKSNSSRGRNIVTDSSVQNLFMALTSLHSKLLTHIKDMDDKRMWYEHLQDKLAQVKDSRAALDVLRQEHQDKLKRIAEEQERQRQMQMAHKLDIMRKKKQEYLQYQRQLALQRIQEQEREMQMRQEQQKALYQMGGMPYPYMGQPGGMAPQQQQGSPMHQINNYPGYGYGQMPPQRFGPPPGPHDIYGSNRPGMPSQGPLSHGMPPPQQAPLPHGIPQQGPLGISTAGQLPSVGMAGPGQISQGGMTQQGPYMGHIQTGLNSDQVPPNSMNPMITQSQNNQSMPQQQHPSMMPPQQILHSNNAPMGNMQQNTPNIMAQQHQPQPNMMPPQHQAAHMMQQQPNAPNMQQPNNPPSNIMPQQQQPQISTTMNAQQQPASQAPQLQQQNPPSIQQHQPAPSTPSKLPDQQTQVESKQPEKNVTEAELISFD